MQTFYIEMVLGQGKVRASSITSAEPILLIAHAIPGGEASRKCCEENMPVYPYQCDECGRFFDRKLPISQADAKQICPNCQGSAHRVFQAPSIIFKGGGFYVTDHRKTSGIAKDQ